MAKIWQLDDAKKRLGTGRVYSTFPLPSTLAGYLGMVIPLIFLLAVLSELSIIRFLSVIIGVGAFITLFFTKSFGGILSTLFSFLVFGFIYFIRRYHPSKLRLILIIVIIFIISSTMFALIGYDRPDAPWNFTHPENPMFLRLKNWMSFK